MESGKFTSRVGFVNGGITLAVHKRKRIGLRKRIRLWRRFVQSDLLVLGPEIEIFLFFCRDGVISRNIKVLKFVLKFHL